MPDPLQDLEIESVHGDDAYVIRVQVELDLAICPKLD